MSLVRLALVVPRMQGAPASGTLVAAETRGRPAMAFEEVLGKVSQWATGAEALATVGAVVSLRQQGVTPPPEIAAAFDAVLEAAGLTEITELPPPQQAVLSGMISMYVGQINELLANPGRAPGWTYTDPAILDGYGRGSAMLPMVMSHAHPDLADVTSFLDVGTGVGLLACAAANVWPNAKVVGIDPWDVSLERARANVAAAGLGDRIELRQTDLAGLGDSAAYDCVWIPSFFLTQDVLAAGVKSALDALKPGGWVVVGTGRAAPDPLGNAVGSLRWIRGGGMLLDPKEAVGLLESVGFADAQIAPPGAPIPLDLVIGRRP
jgi:SAM-dependent methyltransferase